MKYKEIPVTDIQNIRIGQAENAAAGTGCTVFICEGGMRAGLDVRGGGPASRETPVLDPTKENIGIHAIVLSGGSAYGLAAADGVMQCLEEHEIGFDTGFARVPLVVQSCIFDLSYGSAKVRPDKKMGYEACLDALNKGRAVSGSAGAGTGATVGKLCGMGQSMKSGIGYHAGRCVFCRNREKDSRTHEPGAHLVPGQRCRVVPCFTAIRLI